MLPADSERLIEAVAAVLASDGDGPLPGLALLRSDAQSLLLACDVSEELHWFRGHFPGAPVLPGVVQLHWAVTVARIAYGIKRPPREVLRLKYKNVIVPPSRVELTLERPQPELVSFRFDGNGQQHSEGRILFTGDGP